MRISELNKAADKAHQNLAIAEGDFQARLAEMLSIRAKEEQDHEKRLLEMKKDIDILEIQRRKSLEPIEDMRKRAETLIVELNKKIEKADKQQDLNMENADILQDKIHIVREKEEDLSARERVLKSKEDGLELQIKFMEVQNQKINKEMLTLVETAKSQEKLFEQKRTELILFEQSLKAREDSIQRSEKEVDKAFIYIEDQRKTLERALARIPTQ